MIKIPKKYKGFRVRVNNRLQSYGTTDLDKKIIEINRKKHANDKSLQNTLIHEKMHVDHPKMTEKQVYHRTAVRMGTAKKKYYRYL